MDQRDCRHFLEIIPLEMFALDDELKIVFANPDFKDTFSTEKPEGKVVSELIAFANEDDFKTLLERARQTFQIEQAVCRITNNGGEEYNVIVTYSQEEKRFFLVLSREKAFKNIRITDSLTGLPNRELFKDRMNQLIYRADRFETRVAILFLDLNKFKPVNDTYGHKAGDIVLKEVASRLEQTIRKMDTVARFGGDEFVVALSDIKEGIHSILGAKRILRTIEEPIDLTGGVTVHVSASIGIALYPDDETDLIGLIKKADEAMYRAKKSETNYCFYDMSRIMGPEKISQSQRK